MATIGRNAAIAQVGRFRFSGFIACGMWMFIHLLFIEQCHNRLLVLAQWLRGYFTGARSARLIEGASGEEEVLLGSNGDDEAHASPAPSVPQAASGRSRPVGISPDENGGPG
jgi:NADH dehydrogenase